MKLKKLAAAALTAALAAGTIGTIPAMAEDDEMVTLSLYIPTLANYSQDAVEEVQDAINEYTSETYGWKVKLMYSEIGNFEQVINLAMTTDAVDVTCYFNSEGKLASYARNNQLLDITDYFNNASDELKNTFTEAEMTASSVNGRIYGLVRKYQYGGANYVIMNKDIVDEMGIDVSSVVDYDSLETVLYEVQEAHPELTYIMVPQTSSEMMWCYPWDYNVGGTAFAYKESMDSTELKSLFELDAFRELCSYTSKWYKDGLIMADAISNTMEGSDLVSAGTAFCCWHNGDIDPLDQIYSNTYVTPEWGEPHAVSTDIGNLQYGISANSAHPDESFELLSALYTDSKLETLLSYGIEGEHYVLNDEGEAEYPEGMDSTNEPYGGFAATAVYPNFLIIPVKATATYDDAEQTVNDWDASVVVSNSFGWTFDTDPYADFITAYVNLEDQYKDALIAGAVDLDDVLPQIQSQLDSIGFYDVLADMQEEFDAYLAGETSEEVTSEAETTAE
ncbi:MAG: ABC transporter substrate-binding protein [Lachnospiraceae bacterium]|jgi:putative aldouronate transport system substrate-binding protein